MHDFLLLIFSLLRRGIGLAVATIAGCCIILAVVFLIFRIRTKGSKKFPWGKAVLILLLIGYVAVLLYATLLRYTAGFASTNFHLFRAWQEAWNCFSLQAWLNVLLNIALFLPLGVLLPLILKCFRKWYATLAVGFGSSLVIELLQYLLKRGILDVDDLFANTLGCMLGYCIVMLFWTLLAQKKAAKRCLPYLACPLLFAVALTGIFAGYNLKEYGNLEQAPTHIANLKGIHWVLACELDDTMQTAPVYRTDPLDKDSCDAFGAEFAANAGITFPDAYYYDHSTIFANHTTGEFLTVDYYDGSYEFKQSAKMLDLKDAEVDETTLRQLLRPYLINIPENVEFVYEGQGLHTFTVRMEPDGDTVLDGTLRCWCKEGPVLERIENHLVRFSLYKEEPIITQSEAYRLLCSGAFSDVDRFEYYRPQQVVVTSCVQDYRVDTKGFYQPVYVFNVTADGEDFGEVVIATRK